MVIMITLICKPLVYLNDNEVTNKEIGLLTMEGERLWQFLLSFFFLPGICEIN